MLARGRTNAMRSRMMERSELRIEVAASSEHGYAQQAAGRLLESASSWLDWEARHSRLLDSIAVLRRTPQQVRAVRRMALSMIHRKAPFEYLRDWQVRGPARHRFFHLMYGDGDYARVMVCEHRAYINSYCSYLCVDAFCGAASLQRIQAYEQAYASYWQTLASARLAAAGEGVAVQQFELLRYLRHVVRAARTRVLDAAPSEADARPLNELRQPASDTARLRALLRADVSAGTDAAHGYQR